MIAGDELVTLGFHLNEIIRDEYMYIKNICRGGNNLDLYTRTFNLGNEPAFHKIYMGTPQDSEESCKEYFIKSSCEVRQFLTHCKEIEKI